MNRSALSLLLKHQERRRTLHRDQITGADRTLAFGYTCDRDTWHVYLQEDQLHLVVYNAVTRTLMRHDARDSWPVAELVPDKRLYPESTDLIFARLLIDRGQQLPFASYNETRHTRLAGSAFHGATHSDGSLATVAEAAIQQIDV